MLAMEGDTRAMRKAGGVGLQEEAAEIQPHPGGRFEWAKEVSGQYCEIDIA